MPLIKIFISSRFVISYDSDTKSVAALLSETANDSIKELIIRQLYPPICRKGTGQ